MAWLEGEREAERGEGGTGSWPTDEAVRNVN